MLNLYVDVCGQYIWLIKATVDNYCEPISDHTSNYQCARWKHISIQNGQIILKIYELLILIMIFNHKMIKRA